MLLLLFLPQVIGYEIYPCNSINNSVYCQELDYCAWCYNETYGYCNEYPICPMNSDFNCTSLYHYESCNLFNFVYFLIIFSFFFVLTYFVGASLVTITYFGFDGEKKYKPIISIISGGVFISGIITYYFAHQYLSYYIIVVSTMLIFSSIIYYINSKNQRALAGLGRFYVPISNDGEVPPSYDESSDQNTEQSSAEDSQQSNPQIIINEPDILNQPQEVDQNGVSNQNYTAYQNSESNKIYLAGPFH